jgi:uncharacterized damage-inducible protein DinB
MAAMNEGLLDAFRYSDWATRGLLRFCGELDEEKLRTAAVGSYGSILETLNHMLEAESYYLWLMTEERLTWEWKLDGSATIAQLQQSAAGLSRAWERLLQQPFDAQVALERISPEGEKSLDRAGIILVQAIHHPNVHREQVNMILTSQGIQPPDLDVWEYQAWQQANEPRPWTSLSGFGTSA